MGHQGCGRLARFIPTDEFRGLPYAQKFWELAID